MSTLRKIFICGNHKEKYFIKNSSKIVGFQVSKIPTYGTNSISNFFARSTSPELWTCDWRRTAVLEGQCTFLFNLYCWLWYFKWLRGCSFLSHNSFIFVAIYHFTDSNWTSSIFCICRIRGSQFWRTKQVDMGAPRFKNCNLQVWYVHFFKVKYRPQLIAGSQYYETNFSERIALLIYFVVPSGVKTRIGC